MMLVLVRNISSFHADRGRAFSSIRLHDRCFYKGFSSLVLCILSICWFVYSSSSLFQTRLLFQFSAAFNIFLDLVNKQIVRSPCRLFSISLAFNNYSFHCFFFRTESINERFSPIISRVFLDYFFLYPVDRPHAFPAPYISYFQCFECFSFSFICNPSFTLLCNATLHTHIFKSYFLMFRIDFVRPNSLAFFLLKVTLYLVS